jgi:ribonuclease P protein component
MKESSRRRCEALEVYHGESPTRSARAGIVVPRYGHTIVERNRLKRRLRELVRTEWMPRARTQQPPQEVLVRVRPRAYELNGNALREAFGKCFQGVE